MGAVGASSMTRRRRLVRRLRNSASFSWMKAESRSMELQRSRVAEVVKMGPW